MVGGEAGPDDLATARELFELPLCDARAFKTTLRLQDMVHPANCKLDPTTIKGKPAYLAQMPPGKSFGTYTMSRNFGEGTWGELTEWDAKFLCWSWLKRAEAAGRT